MYTGGRAGRGQIRKGNTMKILSAKCVAAAAVMGLSAAASADTITGRGLSRTTGTIDSCRRYKERPLRSLRPVP